MIIIKKVALQNTGSFKKAVGCLIISTPELTLKKDKKKRIMY